MERTVYNYVAVIGIDGMGNFNLNTATPNMDKIFENGATATHALSMDPTISAENWGAMLLGLTPVTHGLTNSALGHLEYKNEAFPSVFKRIRKEFPDAYIASYSKWNPINIGLVEHGLDVDTQTADDDIQLCGKIIEAVAKKPKFLFVQFDNVDGAGHHSGYGNEEHLNKITETDGHVGRIYEAYEKAGIIDETLFLVIADHGGYFHSHGGYMDTEKFVFFGAAGKGIKKSSINYMRTVDIAAIVLYAFGIDMPEYNERAFASQIPENLFGEYTKEYAHPIAKSNIPEFKKTEPFNAENGLGTVMNADRMKLCMFFDNELKDETGKNELKEVGTVKYYSDGVRGSRGEFGLTGSVEIPTLKLGDKSFSISLWIKIDRSLEREAVILATKCWCEHRDRCGICLAVRRNDTIFNIGCGDDDFDFITPYPDSISDGWVHAVFTVDKENMLLKMYYNFKEAHSTVIEPQYAVDLDGLEFRLGDDSCGEWNSFNLEQIVNIDDLVIFDYALDENDIAKLEKFYK